MTEDGCVPNNVRGGGCYWGPNVTENFLNKHNLQLIIRSHECKQDGYEFCHNRKVRSQMLESINALMITQATLLFVLTKVNKGTVLNIELCGSLSKVVNLLNRWKDAKA